MVANPSFKAVRYDEPPPAPAAASLATAPDTPNPPFPPGVLLFDPLPDEVPLELMTPAGTFCVEPGAAAPSIPTTPAKFNPPSPEVRISSEAAPPAPDDPWVI